MEADFADDTGHQIPVDFKSRKAMLPFNLATGIKSAIKRFVR